MRLRDACPGDAPGIAAIQVRAWRVAYAGIVPEAHLAGMSVAERAARWRTWLDEGTAVLLAVDDGGAVRGFCATVTLSDEPPEVAALYLDPGWLRRGIGSELLTAALARLRAAGHAEVTLWVFAANTVARAFYRGHGFADDGGRDEAFPGAPEIRLRASLASSGTFRGPDQEI